MTDDALSALSLGLGLDDPTDVDPARRPVTYAYLVQVSTDGGRWAADWTEPSGGFERSPRCAAQVARQVLRRRFLQLRADVDTHWRDRWFRADVWSLESGAAGDPAVDRGAGTTRDTRGIALSGRHLQSYGVAPDAVEVRTPAQVRAEVGG